jgi:hypothetical protein
LVGSGGSLDRATGARLIVVIVGVSAVGVIAYDAMHKAPGKEQVTVGNATVLVPQHLRSIAGVFVAGTVALIVNEVSPMFGVALALILGIDVALHAFTGTGGIFTALGTNLFGKTTSPVGSPPPGQPGYSGPPVGPPIGAPQTKTKAPKSKSIPWYNQIISGLPGWAP